MRILFKLFLFHFGSADVTTRVMLSIAFLCILIKIRLFHVEHDMVRRSEDSGLIGICCYFPKDNVIYFVFL
jgi:hypothetical protein